MAFILKKRKKEKKSCLRYYCRTAFSICCSLTFWRVMACTDSAFSPNILFVHIHLMFELSMLFFYVYLWEPFLSNKKQGSSDMDQLGKIFAAFGTPRLPQWPDMVYLPDYVEYEFAPPQPLRSLFPMASDDALDLLSKMFTFDPKVRISAQQALEHRCLTTLRIL